MAATAQRPDAATRALAAFAIAAAWLALYARLAHAVCRDGTGRRDEPQSHEAGSSAASR